MVMIRLARIGKNKYPTYRIIVSDKRKDTKGTYLEALGHYNPHTKVMELAKDRLVYWLGKGAQMSSTLYNICITKGFITGAKRSKMHKKEPVKAEEKPQEPAKQEPQAA